jgi:hypothetical protein
VRILLRLSITAAAVALPILSFACSRGALHPMISSNTRDCFSAALDHSAQNRHRPALARLESLLLLNGVSIGVDPASVPAGARGFYEGVSQAVDIWKKALPDCPFTYSLTKPQVVVNFVRQVPGERATVQGSLDATHDYMWSKNSHSSRLSATIYVVYRVNNRNLTQAEIAHVVAHELGHLLGLSDSRQAVGLMGPFIAGRPRLEPSADELTAVNDFRLLVRDTISDIMRRM